MPPADAEEVLGGDDAGAVGVVGFVAGVEVDVDVEGDALAPDVIPFNTVSTSVVAVVVGVLDAAVDGEAAAGAVLAVPTVFPFEETVRGFSSR